MARVTNKKQQQKHNKKTNNSFETAQPKGTDPHGLRHLNSEKSAFIDFTHIL